MIKIISQFAKITAVLIILMPTLGYGQGFSSQEELTISISPTNPEAGETISLTVTSNLSSLRSRFISWSKDGTKEREGVGETRYKSKVGRLGESHTFTVTVIDNSGNTIKQSINVRPAEVILIWEADSYTPIFYKGKGLASHQSEIRVIAIPYLINSNGIRLNEKNLTYEWRVGGVLDSKQSGVGKSTFRFVGKLVSRPQTVTLLTSSASGIISARKTITIDFIDPEIIIYEKNPLTGIRGSFSLSLGFVKETESTFIVEPFFFSRKALEGGSIEYKWTVDGKRLDNLKKVREITFGGDTAGESLVSIEVLNPFSLLQRARGLFKVIVNE